METRLCFVCVCVCVLCAHSWDCTVHAYVSGWMSVSESCVSVQSLPEVVRALVRVRRMFSVFLRGNFLPLEAALVLRNFLSGQSALPE